MQGRLINHRLKSRVQPPPAVSRGAVGKHLLCYSLGMCVGDAGKEQCLDVGVGPGRSQNHVGKLNLS